MLVRDVDEWTSIRCSGELKTFRIDEETQMYIKLIDNGHVLIRTFQGPNGRPEEVALASLGRDPELNLFLEAKRGRRKQPELWEGVHDFHLLQALENYKRRVAGFKPALVSVTGKGGEKNAPDGEDDDS